MPRVAVVDYGMGNLDSVRRGLAVAGAGDDVLVTSDGGDLDVADRIVLPGVGAFGAAMDRLRGLGLDESLRRNVIDAGVPFLGICLGMQLMATSSTEGRTDGGTHGGLGWIPGAVTRIEPTATDERVPHVGWNEVDVVRPHPLLDGMVAGSDCYFVHSYRFRCDDAADVVAVTPYAGGVTSVVARANMVGVQFHPEKSQRVGAAMLRNFLAWEPALAVPTAPGEAVTC